ncbi:MAG: methyltransferase domain-containing protein [Bacteroidetes bacterium]|nr:methyltransferase domain-containing protein [Bacteroidota bacterium]MBU1720962.1 methyltransferase domain-containing protein [Bacteroidota bacterium]
MANLRFDLNDPELINLLDDVPLWSAPFGQALLDQIILKKNITALDIGFGTGFPLTELAMRLGNSSRVFGIDMWESAIARARQKIKLFGLRNVQLFTGSAEQMPFGPGSIDLIVSNNGINNVDNMEQVISECSRVCKSGGQFVQTMNLNGSMIEFYNILKEAMLESGLDEHIEKIEAHIFLKRKPLDYITNLLENKHFRIDTIRENQFTYNFADGTSMLNHFFIRLAFLQSWRDIVPDAHKNAVFSIAETRMNEIAANDGRFSLTIPFAVIDARRA